jgi:hypothetical protein
MPREKKEKKSPSNPFSQPWFDWSTMDSVEIRKAIRLVCMILRSNAVSESRITKLIKDMGFLPKDFVDVSKEGRGS